ncbi:UNVERIFIED_CONTAM: hypothetical protein Slati_0573900 [Sesamum latifolium]|uniref:UEV domain-containing protein n=1 Tax=Sesamum latifolium TaxID=2727402 RepID=A0AAW2Y165_9LAMI
MPIHPTRSLLLHINLLLKLSTKQSLIMAFSSPNPTHFVEDALFCAGPLALSYSDPDQKWIIREHLSSLFQDFPSLRPATGFFTHNDGTEVKLLNAAGDLPVSRPSPPVPVTIWVPELYPQTPPVVYVNVDCVVHPIYDPVC